MRGKKKRYQQISGTIIDASLFHPAEGTSFLLQEEQEGRERRKTITHSGNGCGGFILFVIPITPVFSLQTRK